MQTCQRERGGRERAAAFMRAFAVLGVGCGKETAASDWLPAAGLQPIRELAVRGAEAAEAGDECRGFYESVRAPQQPV